MNSQDFIRNAIKTESVVEQLNIDKTVLMNALKLFAMTAELLDCIKKQAFYNNPTKSNENTLRILDQMGSTIIHLRQRFVRLQKDGNTPEIPENVNTRIAHGVIGISTEAGELAECLLTSLENDSPIDLINLAEELFDGDWYKAVISDECDIDWEEWWDIIIDKLKARYGDRFSEEKANTRDLDAERNILENK